MCKQHIFVVMRFGSFLLIFVLQMIVLQSNGKDFPGRLEKSYSSKSAESFSIPLNIALYNKVFKAYESLNDSDLNIFAIIDYTKPSTEERFFIIDAEKKVILKKLLVAHGKNSGDNFATNFSNQNGSLKSSPGFFRTGDTYNGKHGYSLRLYGLETGFNDHAYERAIVIHGADYVNKRFIEKHKRLGRSWGCPAISMDCSKSVIDLIKHGAVIYIHTNDEKYLQTSDLYNLNH